MIVLSGKGKSPLRTRVKFLIGGLFIIVASLFTIFASTVYNQAIATTNTDLISNAVIILFITDVDEMLHGIVMTIYPRMAKEEEADAQVKEELKSLVEEENTKLKTEMKEMKTELKEIIKSEVSKQVQAEVTKIREDGKANSEEQMKAEVLKQVQAEVAKIRVGTER